MESEIVIKEATSQKDDFKVVQKGNMVESINKLNQVFHYIDLNYVKQGIMFHGWTGFRTTEQLKAVLDGHFMDIYKKYKCKGALVESTKMSGSFNEANDWLAGVFMPKLIGLGLTKVAVVLPHNIFAQMAVDEWDKKLADSLPGILAHKVTL
ncbi:MAG: hypothetical protein HC905_17985 [Bacteroidales bacterium]|nr:hypothetical protein [Bacteroidales bacterium]